MKNYYKNLKDFILVIILIAHGQAQTWNARTSIDAGHSIIYSIFGSDLDGDGFGEVIVFYDDNSTNEELRVYEASSGDTYGTTAIWSDALTTSTSGNNYQHRSLTYGDTDNDGNDEIIFAMGSGSYANVLSIYEVTKGTALSSTNPSTTPTKEITLGCTGSVTSISVANLDGDSYDEIIVGCDDTEDQDKVIEIIEYNGSDWATVLTYDWNDGANDISEPADLDGDGSLEVAAIDEDGVVGVFSFDGSSVTSETVNNSNPSGTSFDGGGNQIAVFNLDNIGLPEIIVSQQDASESSDLRIYTSTSANNYDRSSSNDLHGGVEIQALAVADFDGDGNGEIYYATDGGSAGNDLYHLEYSGSGGSFTSFDFTTAALQVSNIGGVDISSISFGKSMAGCSADKDGLMDMVVTTRNNSSSSEIYVYESTNYLGATLDGSSNHFRFLSSPGTVAYTDLLAELWTQNMTGSDAPSSGSANVWVLSNQSWSALTNLTGNTTLGSGILVYVYEDVDYDGDTDLPINIRNSSFNTSDVTTYSVDNNEWGFYGNPFPYSVDYDLVRNGSNFATTVYVWDSKAGSYASWNGSTGSLKNGTILPYQGFFAQATSNSATLTFDADADYGDTGGSALLRSINDMIQTGSLKLSLSAGNYFDETYFSFRSDDSNVNLDHGDALKLMPLMATSRLVSMTYIEDQSIDINNLPFEYEGTISIPLDVMYLTLEEDNYVTGTSEVSMSWNLDDLPEHVDLTLVDNLTGDVVFLNNEMSHSFTTEPKGSFSATYEEAVGNYPLIGDARFSLQVSYGALDNAPVKVMPKDYALSPVYPNPFNPSATVRFDVPEVSRVELQVYDVTGKLVETLLKERMTAGQHQYTWQPQELAAGTYFLRLITANQTFTQKVTYVK